MVISCAAYNCTERYRKRSGISFHSFPNDAVLRKKWIVALRRDGFNPSKVTKICSNHFTSDCFRNSGWSSLRILNEDAVPTIFDFSDHSKSGKRGKRLKRLNVQCCVLGCEAVKTDIDHGSGLRFFAFPEERTVKNRWIEAIQRKDFDPNVHKAVCSQHFVESDYVIQQGSDEKRLKVRAVPSIFPLQRQPRMGGAEDDVFNIIYDMNPADYDTSDQDQDFEVPEIISDDCIISQASETISEDYSMCQAPETRSQDNIQLSKNQFKLVGKTRDQGTQTSCKDSAKLKLYRCKVKSLLQSVRRKDRRIKQMEEEIALMKEKIKSFKLSNLKLQALNNME
ncbi:THAP domain-containing protein 1-like isoform X1 [Nilaparvata lugens]|uniref:THAP domain-containing protein 1-like isoform X1 n=1 Tax=Nilaparvata lugens TaxID=108931 RepID=UPI00193DCB6A|nr:THAP domain-containing protein 1-like isoform X1 [Nilaparvata lugens]